MPLHISHLFGFWSNAEIKASVFEAIDALASPRSMVMSQQVHLYAAHFWVAPWLWKWGAWITRKDVAFTFLIVFLCGSVSLLKSRKNVAQSSKSFPHTIVLSFQSSEHLQTSSCSKDGIDWNIFCCSLILLFVILKWARKSFLHPRMPQEEFQWVNTLQSRNDTAEDYRAETNLYGTLAASYFFIKIYKLASLLGKKSDPAYLNAENLLQRRSQGICTWQIQCSMNISQRRNFPLIKVILICMR